MSIKMFQGIVTLMLLAGLGAGVWTSLPAATSGSLKWKFKTGGMIAAGPAIAQRMLYFGSMDKHVYAVDGQTGQQKRNARG